MSGYHCILGKVLVHPYMTDPHQHWTQPRFYNINKIEPMLNVEAVYNITNGIPGVFHSGVVCMIIYN
jgi:hypothetical protein